MAPSTPSRNRSRAAAQPPAPLPLDVTPEQLGPPTAEVGVSGTTNWNGDTYAESNAKLIHEQAFGSAGSRTWGEWEKLVRTDPDVSTGIEFNSSKIRDARVAVKAANDTTLARAQADFVRWNITQALEPGLAELQQQQVFGLLGFGFSIHERVFARASSPHLPGGRGWKLAKLAERLPKSLTTTPWKRQGGELAAIEQRGERDGKWQSVLLPANRVVLATWQRSGDNYAGFPATRAVWYLAKIREQLLKTTAISAVREGAGLPIATSGEKAPELSTKQRKALSRLLQNLVAHENAAVVMPKGWNLSWVYSPGANKGHVLDLWRALGLVILQNFQAQQVALGAGDTGSRAVGEVHAAESGSYARGITAVLEGAWNGVGTRAYTGIVRAIVDANWGPQQAYPTVSIAIQPPSLTPIDLVTAVKTGVEAGVITPTLDIENSVRERLGFATIDAATRAALAPKVPPVLAQPAAPGLPAPGLAAARLHRMADGVAFVPFRALRPSEQVLDLARMDSFLNGARDDFERAVRPLVVEALVRLQPQVASAMVDRDPSEVGGLELDMGRIEGAIGDFLEKARAEGYAEVAHEKQRGNGDRVAEKRAEGDQSLAPVARLAAGDEDDRRDDAPPEAEAEEVETRVERVLEAQKRLLARKMRARLLADMEREALEVIRTDGEVGDVVARTVESQLETGAFKSDASSVLTKAWNMGREQFAEERGDQVEAVELSAILDGATCEGCARLDGDTFDFDSAEHRSHVPPLRECKGGDRCRCLLIYRFKRGSR